MNTSLFVGLCEDAGLNVEFGNNITYLYNDIAMEVASISEETPNLFKIDTWGVSNKNMVDLIKCITQYALTPIEERE